MSVKAAELEGTALDYWVARAEGMSHEAATFAIPAHAYSSEWAHGGPIIEREGIGVWEGYDSESRGKVRVWEAADDSPVNAIEITGPMGKGPTPLIAAMRAYVRLKFGREVEDAPHEAG